MIGDPPPMGKDVVGGGDNDWRSACRCRAYSRANRYFNYRMCRGRSVYACLDLVNRRSGHREEGLRENSDGG